MAGLIDDVQADELAPLDTGCPCGAWHDWDWQCPKSADPEPNDIEAELSTVRAAVLQGVPA